MPEEMRKAHEGGGCAGARLRIGLYEEVGEMPQRSTGASVMRALSRFISATCVVVLTIAFSSPASAYMRAQCNAPYTGCLAKCGNRVTQSGASYQQVKKACLDACAAEKTRCLWGASDKGGRHGH